MRTLLCGLLLAAAAAAQSFDTLVPDSAVFYVSIEDAARTKTRWDASRLAALWQDEAMQAFLEKPRAAWKRWMEELGKEEPFTADDVLNLLAGQAVLAVTWPEGADEPVPLILADIGDNAEKLHELAKKVEKQLIDEEGCRRDEEEFRGVKIISYTDQEGDIDSAWLLDGKMFALSQDPETLKDVLARRDRAGEGSLASRELYRRIRGRLGARTPDAFAYVDAPNLIAGAQAAGELGDEEMRFLRLLGIAAAEGLAAEFVIEPKALALRMFLAVKGEKRGVLKVLDGANSALVPPRYVPSDALAAGAWTLDVQALWEETRRVMASFDENLVAQMDAQLAMAKEQIGVDIAGDIIGSFGSGIAYHTLAPAAADADNPAPLEAMGMPRFVFSIEIRNRERFEAALEKLLAASPFAPVTQEYLGVKVRKIPTMFGFIPTLAVLPDRLLFSLETDLVKDVITRYGKETPGLVDREEIAKALATLPPQRFIVSVEDLPKSLAAASSSLASMVQMAAAEEPELAASLDLSLFPSEEVLRKYLGMTVGAMVNEEDGVSYVALIHLVGGE